MKKYIFNSLITICLTLIHFSVVAQTQIIILDKVTNTPISDALINWQGGKTISGSDGYVLIPSNIISFTISRTGYFRLQFEVNNKLPKQIYLSPDNQFPEVEITAYPINPRSLSAPTSYSLISKDIISSANQLDFSSVLNNVPGLFMQNGTLGTNRITIRGIGARTPFGTNKVRAYFNEIPLTAGDGETSLEDNELNTLGKIEVIRGPAATAYGAGLAGLIKLSPDTFKENGFSSSYGIGSFGLSRTRQTFQFASEKHSVNTSYATTFSDGYRENNQYDRENFMLNYRFEGDKIQIDFLSTFIDVNSFIPSSLNETNFNETPQIADSNWLAVRGFEDYTKGLLGITVTSTIAENQKLSGTIFTTFRDNYELRPFGILTENSVLYGSRWKYTNDINNRLSIAIGGEYSIENYENTTIDQNNRQPTDLTSFNDQRRRSINIFTESNWQINDRIEVIGGLNFSKLSYNLTDLFRSNSNQSGKYEFDPVLSPRIFAGYQFHKNHSIYIQLSHGFSGPSVEETLTPDGLINNDIQPEKGLNYELGLKGKLGNSGISYQLNGYQMNVNNLLVARRTSEDQFIGVNAGKSSHRGLETEIYYQKSFHKIILKPFLNLTYNAIEFVDFIDLDDDFSGNKLPGIPNFVSNIGLNLRTNGGFRFTTILRSVGKMFLRDDNILESESYTLLNLSIGYQKTVGRFQVELDGGINNVLDTNYASQILVNAGSFGGRVPRYFYPGNPRNYFTNINLRYNF